ncbi:MAG: ribokinase [Treponema sp.]|jgi:ribokinase|nr:ribokinase [Treponema sp.]
MKTLVFGSLNIDLIFPVDHIVLPGETIAGGDLVKSAGGKGANQAAALAKAGLEVYLAGKIGQDGRFLLSLLNSYGVDTSLVAEYEGATGQAIIQVDRGGQNAIVLYAGGNARIAAEEIDRTLALFGTGDILVLQNEINRLPEIMEKAVERGMKVCLNPSPYDEKIGSLPLDRVDVFFVNEIEAAALAGLPAAPPPEILEALVKRFPRAEIVLTAGKDGALYGHGETRARGEIIDLPVVDTTGAGDTFTGYFTAARARGLPPGESLRIACKASSIAVSRPGAMAAVPAAAEVF